MDEKSFEKFLTEQTKPISTQKKIDWEKEKKEFINFLNALYSKIESSLNEYVESGKISITKENIAIEEEYIGKYNVDRMVVSFGQNRIVLTPIGTNLIGAKGRVDMKGPKGMAKIVLVSNTMHNLSDHISTTITVRNEKPKSPKRNQVEKINWEWRFIEGNKRSYLPVDNATIKAAIMELTNG